MTVGPRVGLAEMFHREHPDARPVAPARHERGFDHEAARWAVHGNRSPDVRTVRMTCEHCGERDRDNDCCNDERGDA